MRPRPARPSDLEAVIDLTCRAYEHYEAVLGGKPIPMTEDYAPRIAKGEVWVLEQGDDLLGLVVLEDRGDLSYLFSVAVAPEHQHAGVGRRLVTFAEEIAKARSHRTVALHTNAKMERNIGIYSSCGYTEIARRPHPHRAGSIVVAMEKQLADPISQAGS